MRTTSRKIILYSLIIVLAAQLNMNLFIADFKISIACICFSVFLFLTEAFLLIPVTICSALGVFLSRIIFYWFQNGSLEQSATSHFPELLFYIAYGLLLYLYTVWCHHQRHSLNKNYILLPLILIDYCANLTELLLRLQLDAFTAKAQASILLIAFIRTAAIWCVLSIFDHYRILLLKKEHEERYQRLILLMAKLNGEVIWMHKNTTLIERTMNTSYKLYEKLKASDTNNELATWALRVANDIHEVKKEYLLIMRGISDALDKELLNEGMYLSELLEVLQGSIECFAKENQRDLVLTINCPYDFYTTDHYSLLSVFRNLLQNAIEAAIASEVIIAITQQEEDTAYTFSVSDNGPGIPAENLVDIFEAGFSTKINYVTGEINRGLGLNLVKDLIEAELRGSLYLTSTNSGTTFTITLPKEKVEVTKQCNSIV